MFSFENIELEFERSSLELIAAKALERKSGARGLKSMIEKILTNTMFEIPGNKKIEKCVVTKAAVLGESAPSLILRKNLKETVL
jgi:ATP-dependent Clp protease ATP-binding subunit ClpX